MQEFQDISNALFSNNVLGLIVAAIIFIITILLLAKKLISFVIAIVLLFFAIISGIAIANNDIVREWMQKWSGKESTKSEPTQQGEDWETKYQQIKQQVLQKVEEIKGKEQKPK